MDSFTVRYPHGRHPMRWVDRILRLLAVYAIPLGLVVFSLTCVFMLESLYPEVSGTPAEVRVLSSPDHTTLDPQAAHQALRVLPAQIKPTADRHAWVLLHLPRQAGSTDYLLEIPSRHLANIVCWDTDTLEIIASADRAATRSRMDSGKLGISVAVGRLTQAMDVLCDTAFTHETRVQATIWPTQEFRQVVSQHNHNIGLLRGSLLTSAILALLIALATREDTYVLLAVWLVTNLRLGTFALGWDTQWLGHLLPLDAMPLIRQLTAAAHYLLTVVLLIRLLRASRYTGQQLLLTLAKVSTTIMLPLALFAPASWFWPTLGASAIFSLITAIYLLNRVVRHTSLIVWFWQMASLALAFSYVIGLSAVLTLDDIGNVDSTVATVLLLLSSAAMTLALAERLRNRRSEQQRLRTELITSYAITPIGMFTLDSQGRFLRMNPVLARMLGFTLDERPHARWTDFFPDVDWAQLEARTRANQDMEIAAKPSVSEISPRHYAIRAITMDKTIEGSVQDISAHTALIEQLRIMAGKDPVTDALNQRGFEQALSEALRQKTDYPSSLAYLSLRQFSSINSLFGTTTGDALLVQLRRKISESLASAHALGRVGSDEFAILFTGRSAANVQDIALHLANLLNNHSFSVGPHAINVNVAIGLIDLSPELDDGNEALFAARRASQDAHKDPRRLITYQRGSAALREYRELLYLFDQLEAGMTPEGFRLEMQPMLRLEHNQDSWNFETLLRVKDSRGNDLSTGRFIAAAEDIGTIAIVDKWVLEETLTWLDQHIRKLTCLDLVSINLSAVSLNSEPFIEHMFQLLARYQHLAPRLIIEMTESAALEDLSRTQRIVHQLQKLGVRIGLDDFGAGYTSFSYLRSLGADMLKIDGALIRNMLTTPGGVAIVQSIIQLARQLKMQCIAEWVEDIETLAALRSMGIDYAQGYVLASAISLNQILTAKSFTELIVTDVGRKFAERLQDTPPNQDSSHDLA